MNYTLYESIYSHCDVEGLKLIKSLPEEKYSFVLLIGINEDKKNKFYQEILKQSKLATQDEPEGNEKELEQFLVVDQKGAGFYIDETSSDNKIIWCNTENITVNNFKDHLIYLRNIARYCSKIILFIEYTDNSRIIKCENFLNELLLPQSQFEDIDLLLCIDMVNPSLNFTKNKNNISENHFKNLKSITRNFNIEYLENEDDDLDTSCLLTQLQPNQLTKDLRKVSCAKFLESIDEPPIKAAPIVNNEPTGFFQEEDFDRELGLNLNPDNAENYNENQNYSIETKESSSSDYYDEKKKNFLNYLSDYCKSETELENWKTSKISEIKKEKEVIMKVYEERKKFFSIHKDIKTFLQDHKLEITEYKKRSSENNESLINYCIEKFKDSFPEHEISDNSIQLSLSKIVKDFIYNDVDIILNNIDSNLKKIIDNAKEQFIDHMKNFKYAPYKYEIDLLFERCKAEWFTTLNESCLILKAECNKTLEIRIEEMEAHLRTIKSQIHELNFKIMECIYCDYLGSMNIENENDIQFICIDDLKGNVMDSNVHCSHCGERFKAIEFKYKNYEFEIDAGTSKVKRIQE